MKPGFSVQRDGNRAIITLDNPPANTFTPESLEKLHSTLNELVSDNVLGLVFCAASERFFSAGADLKGFDHNDPERCQTFAFAFTQCFQRLTHYPGVTVAAIDGFAMGGGLELALACDFRIAEEHCVLALPECSVGLLPCGLGTQHLPRIVGETWAKRMILLGEKVSAEKALEIGLVSTVAKKGEAKEQARRWLNALENQSPDAVIACKRLIHGARNTSFDKMLEAEQHEFITLFESDNRREGVRAFLEKRPPQWQFNPRENDQ